MSAELRDYTIPYTEEELEIIKEQLKKLPSYDGETVSTADCETAMLNIAKVDRTSDQIQAFVDYFDKNFDGRTTIENVLDIVRNGHSPKKLGRKFAQLIDRDGSGVIGAEEFKQIAEFMSVHTGRKSSITYDRFIKEADKDGTGKVDIEECANWLEEQLTSVAVKCVCSINKQLK